MEALDPLVFEDILPFCKLQLGLQGLACLAASNKHLQDTCIAAARADADSLLLNALDAAKALKSSEQDTVSSQRLVQQHLQAVAWLLRHSPTAAAGVLRYIAEHPMSTPALRLWWVKELVAAGVTVSHSQLLEAANSMLAGVEAWVQAQQQLGVQTDIAPWAVAICCGDPWVSSHH
jgi:hypothetical protein